VVNNLSPDMISQFWNLCRACPAMDIDKLHSEYRSTYRWHEYTPKQQQVVRTPPQPVSGSGIDGAEFSRKKKHPDVAYRSHEFFDMTATRSGAMEGGHEGVRVPRVACCTPEFLTAKKEPL